MCVHLIHEGAPRRNEDFELKAGAFEHQANQIANTGIQLANTGGKANKMMLDNIRETADEVLCLYLCLILSYTVLCIVPCRAVL